MRFLPLLVLLAACSSEPAPPPPAEPAPHAVSMLTPPEAPRVPDFLPPPFTAEQIRDAMPVGTTLRFERKAPDGSGFQTWTVTGTTETHATISFQPEAADGSSIGQPAVRTSAWTDLRDHAKFDASKTVASEQPVSAGPGAGPGRRYVLTEPTKGGDVVSVLDFALTLPGPPIRMTVNAPDGSLDHEMVLLDRRSP